MLNTKKQSYLQLTLLSNTGKRTLDKVKQNFAFVLNVWVKETLSKI